jgi:N-acetylglucosaminyldiphosphoundecaprenol N-acetyl-beta-D-mannosaminyltransferase
MVASRTNQFVIFPDAWNMHKATSDVELRRIYRAAAAVFPDGVCWLMLARLQGFKPERIPGPSFMAAACEYGVKKGWRHFFYGGTLGVADKLAQLLPERYPGLKVVGTYSPPFRALTLEEEEAVKAKIEASGADLLWVGLGAPKQEYWMDQHLGKIDVPVMLGVGAAFDFLSASRPWAPQWVRRIGMEWAYRTITGGRRTFWRNLECVSSVALLLGLTAFRRFGKGNHKANMGAANP